MAAKEETTEKQVEDKLVDVIAEDDAEKKRKKRRRAIAYDLPEELAMVLGMDLHVILHDAQRGEVKALIVDHHVLDFRREDAIRWLQERDRR